MINWIYQALRPVINKTKSNSYMRTHLISYDLVAPGRNYETLYDFLKSFGTRAKPLESLYLVRTSLSAKEVRDKIKSYIDTNDKVLVIDVTGDASAWKGLPDSTGAWIKKHM